MSKKEVITKVTAEKSLVNSEEFDLSLVAIEEGSESWGVAKDIEGQEAVYANDLLIPKLWLMQGMSEWVKDRNKDHRAGDWCNSLTGDILGDPDKPINFVVISMAKNWQGFFLIPNEKGEVDRVFSREHSMPVTLENMNLPYSEQIDGQDFVRKQVLRFTIILERDVINNNPQAYVVDFAGTSKKGGRKLYSDVQAFCNKVHTVGEKKYKLPSAAAAYSLTTKEETFEKGDAWVKDITPLGPSSKEAVLLARELYRFIDGNDAVEYHEAYEVDEAATTQVETKVEPKGKGIDSI